VAHGFRNPFRFAIRPGTSELWVGDVGWQTHEEFNRVVVGGTKPANLGWPCYEGTERQPGFDSKNLAICEQLYAESGAASPPAVTYRHGGFLFDDDHCGELPADSTHQQPYAPDEGAASAVAFYPGGAYPDTYDGAMFLGDYARGCLWVVRAGAGGAPDVSTIQPFSSDVGPIVDLQAGPGGDLYYVNIYAGTIRRIAYGGGGTPPPPPPPSGDAPTATISAPTASTTWAVGDSVSFAGSARDASGAAIPAAGLAWSVILHHCYTAEQCHEHPYQSFDGVASGSFTAPDHEYPAYVELRLDATDGAGRTGSTSTRLDPQTVDLSFESQPSGMSVVVGGAAPAATPFTVRAIVGATVDVSASSPQQAGGVTHSFASWSDGGEQSHAITAPASASTYRVTYQPGDQDRLAGGSREETAAAVSRATFAPGAPVAYVARADDYPDALAGGPAGARLGGPILLVSRDAVPPATAGELERLRPQRIILLGGTRALSDAVGSALQRYSSTPVERIAGTDRYATAALVSRQVFPAGTPVVYVATGERFPDALAGGAAAAAVGAPVLLVRGASIPDPTAEELRRLRPGRIVVLGGTGAVSAGVQAALGAFEFGPTVERRQGRERFETAAAISAAAFPAGVETAYLATGRGFADALAAVPAAGKTRGPVLLVDYDSLPQAVADELTRLAPRRVVVLGGELAVAAAVQTAAQAHVRR
jgi:putative cell wall-binding protein